MWGHPGQTVAAVLRCGLQYATDLTQHSVLALEPSVLPSSRAPVFGSGHSGGAGAPSRGHDSLGRVIKSFRTLFSAVVTPGHA